MPMNKSMAKRLRQSRVRAARNRAVRSALRTSVRKSREAIAAGDAEAAQAQVRATLRLLDKTVSKGVIHKNAARRRKSRLARRLAREVGAAPQPGPSEAAAETQEPESQ
jgi:small subunit ribosomal protein S20